MFQVLHAGETAGSARDTRGQGLVRLLSQALIAFTVEADNELELVLAHRTSAEPRRRGPWLTSMVCWTNGLRHVGDGVTTEQLERSARTRPNIAGLLRWGYLRDEAGVLRLTAGGRRACECWEPIPATIEARWSERFGAGAIRGLRAALASVAVQAGEDLPDGMPVLGFGMRSDRIVRGGRAPADLAERELPALLSRALLRMTLTYEERTEVSLAVASTILRVLEQPVGVAELPERSGAGKETVAVALNWLRSRGLIAVGAGRGRAGELTERGRRARELYLRRLAGVEAAAAERVPGPVAEIRATLGAILDSPRLSEGLAPPPSGWRARASHRRQSERWARDPAAALPHFPLVTHRGGWPDGS